MLELSKGTQLAGRYTLDRRLGGGGEAQLWLAKDRLTAASVALKISHSGEDPGSTQIAERLRREWQTHIRLMHAHIVRVFEFHRHDEFSFYSQQFIDGPDISVVSGMSLDKILAPIGLLADALRYVHGKDLVHRDIKASNVLLDHNGAPYLSDFGVASAAGQRASGGSPVAQSPQSLAGQVAQPADDVFALGGLIYELISGRPPYSSADLAAEIVDKVPETILAADGSRLPAAVQDLLARMLSKDADERPAAKTVADELRAAGFEPGPASISVGARSIVVDEVIETVESIHPVRSSVHETLPEIDAPADGISTRTMGISLVVLLALLLVVIFVLPDNGSEDSDQVADMSVPEAIAESRAEIVADDFGGSVGDDLAGDLGEKTALPTEQMRDRSDTNLPTRTLGDDKITFNENAADYSGLDEEARARFETELMLGELLAAFEVLESRGVERWAAVEYLHAKDLYARGDTAYLERDFATANALYVGAIAALEPLFDRIEPTFEKAFAGAVLAFDAGDRLEALRLFDLAVAITPNHPGALAGYERAKNLEAVLGLMDQGRDYEKNLELEAAYTSYAQAVELDELWLPAQEGLARVEQIRTKMAFDLRMTEGFDAISTEDYLAARAAFRMAKQLMPKSVEPADGLLQVDQGIRLDNIQILEQEALTLEQDEHWEAVVTTYQELLKVDSTLLFALDGLQQARDMVGLHEKLEKFIEKPVRLSIPAVMQDATGLVVGVTVRSQIGPRLAAQRDELSRLLKRAVTPLIVPLLSDNVTQVSIYRVGRLGNFMRKEVRLRPGTYVAVGIRPGYRDVRREFRVAPELVMEPVIVRCEEQI